MAQKLSRYHFRINYRQGKANGVADTLLRYRQQNAKEEATFQTKNTKILHRLQFSLANVSGLSLDVPSLFYQILVCFTTVLLQLWRFWDFFQSKIANEGPYNVNIRAMRIRLPDLQSDNNQARKLQAADFLEGWEDIEGVLQYEGLFYIPKIIWLELISQYYNDPLASHFEIDKTRELISRKYYWFMLRRDVEAYMKGCDVCLGCKAV